MTLTGSKRAAGGLLATFGGWLFLLAVGILYAAVAVADPSLASAAVVSLLPLLARIAPVLGVVFGLLFLASAFLDRSWLVRHLGSGGARGWMIAVMSGVLAAGPLYAWYPLLADLRDKGMSRALIATFIYSRALKLPLLPLMLHYFGAAYTVALSAGILVCAVVCGVLTTRLAGDDSPGQDRFGPE